MGRPNGLGSSSGCFARMGFGCSARPKAMSEAELVELEELAPERGRTATMEDSSGAPPAPSGPEVHQSAESELDRVRADLDRARADRDEMLDKLRRAQAEFENTRKRLRREKEEVFRYAASDTIQALLPVVDDFERAMESEGLNQDVKKGLELIYRRIFDVFAKAGLKEVPQHETFDPELHFAVDRAPATEEQRDQQILDVYQKGYFFKDRLLRASMVKVAVQE